MIVSEALCLTDIVVLKDSPYIPNKIKESPLGLIFDYIWPSYNYLTSEYGL